MLTKPLKHLILQTPQSWRDMAPHRMQRMVKTYFQQKALDDWKQAGRPAPPPHLVKVQRILDLQKKRGIKTLVETGTYMGDMLDAVQNYFDALHSIELSNYYHQRAKKIFSRFDHIKLHLGDSGMKLAELLADITEPAIFWLDAHYSGGKTARAESDTPVLKELKHIFKHAKKTGLKHVILIDDAREFTGETDYPSLEKLKKFVAKYSDYKMKVKDDCLILER